jgi:hypothetical protein
LVSASLDVRFVVSPRNIEDQPIRAIHEGALGALCLNKWGGFLCGGLYAGLVHFKPEWSGPWPAVPLLGPAVKIGRDFELGEGFSLRLSGDLVVPIEPVGCQLPGRQEYIWRGDQVMGTLSGFVAREF